MESGKISREDIGRLRKVVKKAGIRRTCGQLGHQSTDQYYNIIQGRSNNMDAYKALMDAAIELIIQEDDHVE